MFEIKDGTGTGSEARVDIGNRLHVDAVQRTQSQQAILKSNGYNISTGSTVLVGANSSAVFYLKNDESSPLVIKELIVILGASTGGAGNAIIEIIRNPSLGTIIDNAVNVNDLNNRDFGSQKSLAGDIYKGAEGDTVTNGSQFAITTRSNFDAPINFDADIIALRKGNSIAVRYTPPTGNTSQSIVVACNCFVETQEIN